MIITILTLFPEIFPPIFNHSILGRAQKKGLLKIRLVNIREYARDRHKSVDDRPYGGGVGMIMRVDVVECAISTVKSQISNPKSKFKEKIILLDPRGKQFNQSKAQSFAKLDHLILVCGHYEGIDERITGFVDEKISVGKYILTGGEIPSMVITDAVARLIPGVFRRAEATRNESFGKEKYLEEPQYTRPEIYKGLRVPKILLSGDHEKILNWKKSRRKLLK